MRLLKYGRFVITNQGGNFMEMEKIPNNSLEIKNKTSIYFIQGVKDCIPTIFGYLSIGFACGILSKSCGLTFVEAIGMSIFIYAGSAQFIASSMILSNASIASIILTIFFVNFRHLFMSASLAPYFKKNSLLENLSIGVLLTDETFLVASAEGMKKKHINYWWMMGLNIIAYLNWVLAAIPTLLVAIKKNNLLLTVVIGIISVGVLRFIF